MDLVPAKCSRLTCLGGIYLKFEKLLVSSARRQLNPRHAGSFSSCLNFTSALGWPTGPDVQEGIPHPGG